MAIFPWVFTGSLLVAALVPCCCYGYRPDAAFFKAWVRACVRILVWTLVWASLAQQFGIVNKNLGDIAKIGAYLTNTIAFFALLANPAGVREQLRAAEQALSRARADPSALRDMDLDSIEALRDELAAATSRADEAANELMRTVGEDPCVRRLGRAL